MPMRCYRGRVWILLVQKILSKACFKTSEKESCIDLVWFPLREDLFQLFQGG